jgi:hypothetical protein
MNRRERKHMEKELGLDKFYKTMSRSQWFEKMRNNIIAGKRMQEEMKNKVKSQLNQQEDKKESDIIASNALTLAITKKMPMIDAMALAKEEYDANKK